jgi:DNA-binding response OmpR family regulator
MSFGHQLQRAGYTVYRAASSDEALQLVRTQRWPNLAIIDYTLTPTNGIALAEQLRAYGPCQIIYLFPLMNPVVTAVRATEPEVGYLVRPFTFAELLAQVQQCLGVDQPHAPASGEVLIDEQLIVNFDECYAVLQQKQVLLTPTEARLLQVLYQRRGQMVTSHDLMTALWQQETDINALWVHLSRLRSKIEPTPQRPRYIVTVRKNGYVLPTTNATAQLTTRL